LIQLSLGLRKTQDINWPVMVPWWNESWPSFAAISISNWIGPYLPFPAPPFPPTEAVPSLILLTSPGESPRPEALTICALTHPTEKPSGMQRQKLIFHHHRTLRTLQADPGAEGYAVFPCLRPFQPRFIAMCNSSISFYQFSPLSNGSREPRTTRPSTQLYITLQFVVYLLKDMQIWLARPQKKEEPFPRLLSFFICVDFSTVCLCVWVEGRCDALGGRGSVCSFRIQRFATVIQF